MPFLRRTLLLALLAATASLGSAWAGLAEAEEVFSTRRVEPGENLSQIAVEVGIDLASLAAYNSIEDPDLVPAGLVLRLPPPRPRTHTVAGGETLTSIAARYGFSVGSLAAANHLQDANQLPADLTLRLPTSPPEEQSAAPTATTPNDGAPIPRPVGLTIRVSYVVQPGDTLAAVAQTFNTTPAALAADNGLEDPDQLAAGNTLLVPVPANGPDPQGQTTATAPSPPNGTPPRPQPSGQTIKVPYLVQPGDTLTSLAQAFDTSVATLTSDNGLQDPNDLVAGATILIPIQAAEHRVVEGETLASVAARYKTDLGSLVDFNGLSDPNLLLAGEVILIPSAAVAPTATGPGPALAPTPAPVATATPSSGTPAATSVPRSPPAGVPTSPGAASTATSQPAPTPVVPTTPPPPPGPASAKVVSAAVALVGRPYVWGGSDPTAGFDCSGLVWYVVKQAGRPISRGLFGQYQAGANLGRAHLQPGDLVFFQNTYMPGLSHNGIYIGNGKFIHAADEVAGVSMSSLDDPYWAPRWFGATRVF